VENKSCPFCGGQPDPKGWMAGDGQQGPECEGCGATAESLERWNTRCSPPVDHQQSNVDFVAAAQVSYLGDCTDSDERLAAAWWGWRAARGEIPAKSDLPPLNVEGQFYE
jgi:hypothetical protein